MAKRRRTAKQDEISQRRTAVSTLLKGGASQREIADQLGVSLGTVNGDIQALRQEWASEREDVHFLFDLELRRLEDMVSAIYESALRGHLPAIDTMLRIHDRRVKLLGLDAAHRLNREMYDDWKTEAISVIQENNLGFDEVADEIGHDLATELFAAAGVRATSSDQVEAAGTEEA